MSPLIVGIVNHHNYESVLGRWSRDAFPPEEAGIFRVLEFRGDSFTDALARRVSLERLREAVDGLKGRPRELKVLYTLRLPSDGGDWSGPSKSRKAEWDETLELYDWIDVEMERLEELDADWLMSLQDRGKKVVLSHHNFKGSYSQDLFYTKIQETLDWRPDIVKFAVTAQSLKDVVTLLEMAIEWKECGKKMSLMSMGKWGPLSRLATPLAGAEVVYGHLGERPVVPGQLSALELSRHLDVLIRENPVLPDSQKILDTVLAYVRENNLGGVLA